MAHPLVSAPVPTSETTISRAPLVSNKSFSRYEPSPAEHSTRHRAATMNSTTVVTDILSPQKLRLAIDDDTRPDVFDSQEAESATHTPASATESIHAFPEADDLPIELVSLADRFIDSISTKAHPTPPTMDKLAPLFQDFYALAASTISTHISTLSLKQRRRSSPPRSTSRSSSIVKTFTKTSPLMRTSPSTSRPSSSRSNTEKMLTGAEMTNRRQHRRMLETKRVSMEEAVERRVCEGTYSRIFKHLSTTDDERDDKLRSRTAALSVVGIGLKELGIMIDPATVLPDNPQQEAAEAKAKEWLAPARAALMGMNDEHYPLGKLHHLKQAHKAIVDALSLVLPSSSSADEILPMLIYTLITTPAEGTNVISNMNFIQRFRNETKMDGEAAYCLTNLEAAVTFVETVDLSTLKADELPSGPVRNRSTSSLQREEAKNAVALTMNGNPAPMVEEKKTVEPVTPSAPKHRGHQRSISQLLQPPTQALGAASDAVINTADQGLKTIGYTLENSYKFLFGRLRERQVSSGAVEGSAEITVPKTLDEARKLVSTPPPADEEKTPTQGLGLVTPAEADPLSVNSEVSSEDGEPLTRTSTDERLLTLIGGRNMARDGSRDSANSYSSSSRRVSFAGGSQSQNQNHIPVEQHTPTPAPPLPPAKPAPPQAAGSSSAVDTMRSLGNSLNPLNRLSMGMGMMRTFGRSSSSLPLPTPTKEREMLSGGDLSKAEQRLSDDFGEETDLNTAFPGLAPSLPPKDDIITTTVTLSPESLSSITTPTQASMAAPIVSERIGSALFTPAVSNHPAQAIRAKIAPPVERYMTLDNPGDLRLGEVLDLLRDYRRLAKELEAHNAF